MSWRRVIAIAIGVSFTPIGAPIGESIGATPNPPVEWTMIQVCDSERQADAHLLRFADGKTFLIDAARNGQFLLPYLMRVGVRHLHKVLITHPHTDHYGGLLELVKAGIRIDEVNLNLPDQAQCDREIPWGCNSADITGVAAELVKRGIPVKPVSAKQVLYSAGETSLEVIAAYDGVHTPIGKTDINDTSILLRLSVGKITALLTGDLNDPLGAYLARSRGAGQMFKADLLKVPHHGTESTAPNSFFDQVSAKVALVPAPASLWKSDRSKRIRDYFQGHKTPTFVSGVDGNLTVTIDNAGYQITNSSGKLLHSSR